MDYKEKYNKLVEAIKVLQETNPSDEVIQNWVNDNVPELKGPEDERIRKEIIAILQYKYEKFSKDPKYCNAPQWLAWLEKQGKPKWSEEDEKCIDNCCLLIGAADNCYEKTFKDDCIHYLQNLKKRMGV